MKAIFYLSQIFIIILIFIFETRQDTTNYTRVMTMSAFYVQRDIYIDQIDSKKCKGPSTIYNSQCQNYCRIYYAYVPNVPYNNLASFNKQTLSCIPRLACPKAFGVFQNKQTNQCQDQINGKIVPYVNAQPPDPIKIQLINVTFYCLHGRIITFNGFLECQCNLGYKTVLILQGGVNEPYAVMKCNQPAKYWQYLPQYLQIKYDPSLDNIFPYALDQNYWCQIKYSIQTFFQPWQAQLYVIVMQQQDLLRQQDIKYLYWGGFVLLILFLISYYEKNVNGRISGQNKDQQRTLSDLSDQI